MRVRRSRLVVRFDGVTKVDADVGYWKYPTNYFKAGDTSALRFAVPSLLWPSTVFVLFSVMGELLSSNLAEQALPERPRPAWAEVCPPLARQPVAWPSADPHCVSGLTPAPPP